MAYSTQERQRQKAAAEKAVLEDKYNDDWDLALKIDAIWDLVTEWLFIDTNLVEDEPALVREYVDRTIAIMTS